jgi:prepilin-type processing-associated H-X9-DG protein
MVRPGDETGLFPTSYALSSIIIGQTVDAYQGGYYVDGSINLADVKDPSELIAVADSRFWHNSIAPDFRPQDNLGRGAFHRHGKWIDFLFLDGHVKPLKAIQTFTPQDLWHITPIPASILAQAMQAIAPEYR